ncbi:MAG TPA: choice-of-anchor D domain-containing protein, partial [Terriglobales bacterium]
TTSTPQTLLVTNSGTAALTISAIATTGDFSQTNNCGTSLAPSASCNIQVAFTPTGVGVRTGTLSITDNALGSPQTVLLSGAGIAPGPSCAPLVQSTSTLFTISVSANCSDLSGTITSITIDWGDGSQLTSGSSGTHTYSAAGTYTVTVTATDNFMLVGSNSVSAILTAPPPPGTAGQVTTVTFSAPTGAPASTFSCTSAIGPGGQLILDLSTVGISCTFSSPPGTPTEIDLAINTTGGTIAALHRPHVSTFSTSLAFWMPLPAIVILGSGVLGVRSRRKAFGRYLTIGLLVVFLATLSSCGGGFTLRQPQSLTTPPGTYYITSVGGSTDPVTGFRQVSLIVPLTVTGH